MSKSDYLRKEKNKALLAFTLILFFTLFLKTTNLFAQKETIVKTNILSLLFSVPTLSVERQISNHGSIFINAYSGSYAFYGTEYIRGMSLSYRMYGNKEISRLNGLYVDMGITFRGTYVNDEVNYDYDPGIRAGLGYQFGKKAWVFDFGAVVKVTNNRFEVTEPFGLPEVKNKLEQRAVLNCSVGFRF